jgi:hypothetical protein
MSLDLGWVPDACTLPSARRPIRLAEFDVLFRTAVRQVERVHHTRLRLTLAGSAGLAATVRDLAERESRCCSFFTFEVLSPEPGHAVLDITVPAAYVEVLDVLAARATGPDAR